MNEKLKQKLEEFDACADAVEWTGERTLKQAWEECPRGDWMLWLYAKLYPKNLRELTLAKGHCANTIRHLMTDKRSMAAIDVAIAFGEGKVSLEDLNAAYADAAAAAGADFAYAAYAAAGADSAYAAYAGAGAAAAAYAAYSAGAVADAACAAAYAARAKNRKQTADICRQYLTIT